MGSRLLLGALILGACTDPNTTGLLFVGDFESGDLSAWQVQACCDYSSALVSEPVRTGLYAARFELRRNDPTVANGKRSEMFVPLFPASGRVGDERWFGLSFLVPTNWEQEEDPSVTQSTLAQWHARPDRELGEGGRSPPLRIDVKGNDWSVRSRWDPKRVTEGNDPRPEGGDQLLWAGPFEPGVWTDWVIHVKWSYTADGLLEVWKDGIKVVERRGPNTYNDEGPLYLKVGMYKPSWGNPDIQSTTHTRVAYHDDIQIGDGTAGYARVAPGQRDRPRRR